MISYNFVNAMHKGNGIFIIGCHFIHLTTHGLNFLSNVDFVIIMNNEIELHLCPVDVFIIIQTTASTPPPATIPIICNTRIGSFIYKLL